MHLDNIRSVEWVRRQKRGPIFSLGLVTFDLILIPEKQVFALLARIPYRMITEAPAINRANHYSTSIYFGYHNLQP